MLASVSASLLNVRSLPSVSGRIMGTQQQGDIVVYDSAVPGWVKIDYGHNIGFVAERFIQPITDFRFVKGRVKASLLNVRNGPSIGSPSIGSVVHESELRVLSFLNDWIEIEFNSNIGYVSREFITLTHHQTTSQTQLYEVTARLLNIRKSPSSHSNIVGQLSSGNKVEVLSDLGRWKEIMFNGLPGFVASTFLVLLDEEESGAISEHQDEHSEQAPVAIEQETQQPVSVPSVTDHYRPFFHY